MSKKQEVEMVSEQSREYTRYLDKSQDRYSFEYKNKVLPQFCQNLKTKRGTVKEFLALARLEGEVYDNILASWAKLPEGKRPKKIDWQEVIAWKKKYSRKYPYFFDFRHAASKGRIEK